MKAYSVSSNLPGSTRYADIVVAKDENSIKEAFAAKFNVRNIESIDIIGCAELPLERVYVKDLTAYELFTLYEEFRKNK